MVFLLNWNRPACEIKIVTSHKVFPFNHLCYLRNGVAVKCQSEKPYSQVRKPLRSDCFPDDENWVFQILGDDDSTIENCEDDWVVDDDAKDIINRLARYSRKYPP